MSMTDAERIAALISGQESFKQQTVRIRAAALNGRPERPGIDTEDIVRELVAELAQARAERDALRADAERFAWWFSFAPKPDWFVARYLQGVREKFTLDQWRYTIDDARAKEKA